MEGWFTEKSAFQLRQSTPGAEGEDSLQKVEGAVYTKDLKWKNDGPSKEQKESQYDKSTWAARKGVERSKWPKMTQMKLQRTCLLSCFSCV